jgi:hypothetical protein
MHVSWNRVQYRGTIIHKLFFLLLERGFGKRDISLKFSFVMFKLISEGSAVLGVTMVTNSARLFTAEYM